jgi:hypothetical protein
MGAKLIRDPALRWLVEINQDIPAEYDVDIPVNGIDRIHQVHPHEIRRSPQFRNHPHFGS